MQSKRCDDASNTGLIEINGVAPKLGCNPFWGSILFNESYVTSATTRLMLTFGVNRPLH